MTDKGLKTEDGAAECAVDTTPRSDASADSPGLFRRPKAQSFGSFVIAAKTTVNDSLLSEIDAEIARPSKKKRRIFSCESCRKLKTKCDYDASQGSCKRCLRLRLECSLVENGTRPNRQEFEPTPSEPVDSRLRRVEQAVESFDGKLTSLLDLVKQSLGSGNQLDFSVAHENELLANHDALAPLNVIKQIDSKLFNRASRHDPFKRICDEFLRFYFDNERLCLELSRSFLEISHFWIIPGGITSIDRKYVLEHPFITCVFVLLAMCFDENYKYVQEQQQLYMLATKLLGIALVTEPLSDHDIEAILYISLYNIARKPKQSEFDSWLLSSIGLKHLIISIDFKNISRRVGMNIFNEVDLFHLRIFNSMCSCHFQNSIGYARPIMLTSTYYDLFELTLKFPKATLGDAIKVAEIELYLGLSRGLTSSPLSYYVDGELLCFPEQHEWKQKWSKVIQKDVSQMLTFAYNFSHIMLARKLVEKPDASRPELRVCYSTACQYSFETLNRFLLLSNNLVKGSPSFQLNLVVYACITLCDYLDTMGADERKMSLNLISKIYWHLNKVGEKMNDATDTIAKIVRKLVDIANETHSQTAKARNSSQNSETLSVADLPQQVAEQLYSPAEPYTLPSHTELRLPDVAAFDNFEDFFKDLFDR